MVTASALKEHTPKDRSCAHMAGERPFDCDDMVRDQIQIRLHPQTVLRKLLSREVRLPYCLELATQAAKLFIEAETFGSEIRECFCVGQRCRRLRGTRM